MKANGYFGEWFTDDYGLPAYNYTCNQFIDPNAKTNTTHGSSIDHFHQIGNDRITATAHNGGYIQVLDSSRGFQWLTYRSKKKNKFGGGIALIQTDDSDKVWSDLYNKKIIESNVNFQRIFGMGYFQKIININQLKLKIIHNICAPFSNDSVFISEIEIFNNSESTKNMKLIDFWDIFLHHILRSLIVTADNRKTFGKNKILNGVGKFIKFIQKITRTDTEGSRKRFDNKFYYKAEIDFENQTLILTPKFKRKPPVDKAEPAKHDFYPKSIFLSMLYGNASNYFIEQDKLVKNGKFKIDWEKLNSDNDKKINHIIENSCLGVGIQLSLKPKDSKKIICIFGYSEKNKIKNLIQKYKGLEAEKSILKWNAKKCEKSLIELNCQNDSWLARETKWHSYYTRSACYFDEYFSQHKFPQGSIYQFGHGFDGAIRDYIFFLNAIIFIDPQLAKEYLSFILSLMSPDGTLPYSLYGFAKTFTGSVHSKPSDLHLFFIWGILQYVYTTRDFDFLNIEIEYYPKSLNKRSTVLQKIYVALEYLFSDKVGIGEHGLIKSNDGDWSDGISLMVNKRKKFIKYGESTFNSTFALYIIPKLIPLLRQHDLELAERCKKTIDELKKSVQKSWNGKWFYRGWDGKGNPIGDKNIYLEHHTWLLIAKVLEREQALNLINHIFEKLDKPSQIGQYISFPPQKVKLDILPKGWDVNGGIWHAMNALLTWGYSNYDIVKAFNSLKKNSLTQRAETYPQIWYGIWSGPDAYIANHAENPGEAFYHLATPMCDFPLMNLNIHACYLLSVIKIAGFDAQFDSIIISPKIIDQDFTFKSPLLSIESKPNYFSITFNPINSKKLILKIQKPKWWTINSRVFLNGINITLNQNLAIIKKKTIIITIKEDYKQIKILFKH